MNTYKIRRNEIKFLLFSLFVAFLFIGLFSKNSPLYPMNDWMDVNCYRTVADSMLHGKVMYRDIMDHKGPIWYMLFFTANLFSRRSFLGVYLIETALFGSFLYMASKILRAYIRNHRLAYPAVLFLGFAVTVGESFSHGGSAEEFCLVLMAYSLYYYIKLIKEEDRIRTVHHIASGICIGLEFWIKFTLAGIASGGFIYLFIYLIRRRKTKELLNIILWNAVGFIITCIPVVIYFAYTNAFYDLWRVYFYNNIFLYSNKSVFPLFKLGIIIGLAVFTTVKNLWYGAFTVGGLILMKKREPEFAFLIVTLIITACVGFIGGQVFGYYGLVLVPFSVYGMAEVILFAEKKYPRICRVLACRRNCAAGVIILLGIGYLISPNTYLLKYPKSAMPQFRFAERINKKENATLLNYGFLDGGFYFAADVLPDCRFFCETNLEDPQMYMTQADFINNAVDDYVVTRDYRLENDFDISGKYKLVDEVQFVLEKKMHIYCLYEKQLTDS